MKERRTIQGIEKRIREFYGQNRRMPTYSEMMELFSVRSKSVVQFWVKRLLSEGILEKDMKGFLKPAKQSLPLPLVGEVKAGFPSPAEEELRDLLSLDEYLITKPAASFLLKVSGDSMTEAGIMEGDLVIVERGREPKTGNIVLAEVDGDWTMKYFRRKGKTVFLESGNPKYPTIRPKAELRIGGVVTAVIRKYSL